MLERWGDRYCLIGPYNPQTAAVEFEEQPTYGSIRDTMQRLKDSGLPCYFGRWLIAGRPRVILIDYRARYGSLSHDKYLMWTDHGISTSSDDGEVNEVIAFGFAVAEFFRVFTQVVKDRPVLAGNSIHLDRRFIRRYMPQLDTRLHYRMVDVSTIKELARRWFPQVIAKQKAKKETHSPVTA